jgi:chromodomain protein Y
MHYYDFVHFCEGVERLVLCLAGFPKLLVAAVNGLASGLGLALLPLCDLVYASDTATFTSLAAR